MFWWLWSPWVRKVLGGEGAIWGVCFWRRWLERVSVEGGKVDGWDGEDECMRSLDGSNRCDLLPQLNRVHG